MNEYKRRIYKSTKKAFTDLQKHTVNQDYMMPPDEILFQTFDPWINIIKVYI